MATVDLTVDAPAVGVRSRDGAADHVDRPTGSRGLPHIRALDGIRAIAVLGVLLYHGNVSWMSGGFLGVDVFFVLSGFLITSLVLTELDRTTRLSFKQFYLRRARRLLPALMLVLLASAILGAVIATDAAGALRRDIPGAFFYVTNWVYVFGEQSYFEITGRPPLLQHLWSLAVEEQFYLIWPAVVVLAWRGGGRDRVRRWALIGAIGSTVLMVLLSLFGGYPEPNDGSRAYFGTDAHAMGLLLGAALATVWLPQRLRKQVPAGARAVINAVGACSIGVVVLIMMTTHDNSVWLYRGGFLVFAGLVAVMIAAVSHPASMVGGALGRQPWRYIGERSYGLYLWHWPIFLVLRPGLDVPLEDGANLVLRLGLTFLAAELSYRYVEMPIRHGVLRDRWRAYRSEPAVRRRQQTRKLLIGSLAAALILSAIGLRLWTIPDETQDYLGGLTSVSALDESEPTPGKNPGADTGTGGSADGDAMLSDTITADGPSTLKPGILAVGESVMLGAQSGLKSDFKKIAVDASVARQASDMLQRLRALRDAGALRETIVLHTGTNGYVERDQLEQMLKILAPAKRLVVVNVHVARVWEAPNNELLTEMVSKTPNAVLADWSSRADSDRSLLVADGTHLTKRGIEVYAETIRDALLRLESAQQQAAGANAPQPPPQQ